MKSHVALVIKNSNNQILFIKRSMMKKSLPGIWSFASGTLEDGESVEETAIREGMEELGIELLIEKEICEKELPELNVKLHFLLCKIANGEPKVLDYDEIERFEWMGFDDFFNRFSDDEIGHGLIWLRQNKDLLGNLNNY